MKYRVILQIAISVLMIAVLIGCTLVKEKDEEHNASDSKVERFMDFNSDDGTVNFTIMNEGSFSESTMLRVKSETLQFYNELERITDETIEEKEVIIELEREEGISYYWNGIIYLRNVNDDREHLAHELVHALLGYDYKNAGYFTLDGLAMYLEAEITSEQPVALFSNSSHELMKYLKNQGIIYPAEKLMDPQFSFEVNDMRKQIEKRWLFYVQTNSFSNYLIDTYRLEQYMKIYNKPDLLSKLPKVYGKELIDLEREWLEFIDDQKINKKQIEETIPSGLLERLKTEFGT